jgi:hypothetical protein
MGLDLIGLDCFFFFFFFFLKSSLSALLVVIIAFCNPYFHHLKSRAVMCVLTSANTDGCKLFLMSILLFYLTVSIWEMKCFEPLHCKNDQQTNHCYYFPNGEVHEQVLHHSSSRTAAISSPEL